ncbi:putative nucleotide-diphospho-sugar transferase [Neisseriaceae bacterium ESL0693]|nr:putative nucleotide-diphospho-sugar transferase [Neisseriaceae bacterium ESL0693]
MKFNKKNKNAWRDIDDNVVAAFPKIIATEIQAYVQSPITVVAFHTNDELYRHEAKRLCASALRIGITVKTTVVRNQHDWVKNTSFKSAYLQRERELIRGPILYVDVDAVFHRSPLSYLTQLDYDIAVHYDLGDGHLISSTLFFQDTAAARELLARWNQQCQARPDVWDQKVLEDILTEDQQLLHPRYRLHRLPVEFCWVFDRNTNVTAQSEAVYIEQLQVSREYHAPKGKNSWFVSGLFHKKKNKNKVQRRIDRIREIEEVLF